jgi:hypothetical protein
MTIRSPQVGQTYAPSSIGSPRFFFRFFFMRARSGQYPIVHRSDYFFGFFLSCFGFLTSRLRTLLPLPMCELH